jgi:hypothetical protein
MSAVHVLYDVLRGADGMGMDVSSGNVIVRVVPGGQAEADGLMREGDVILAVDGCVVAAGRGTRGKRLGGQLRGAERREVLVRRDDPALAQRLRKLGYGASPFAAPPSGAEPLRPAFRLLTIPVGGAADGPGIELNGGAICLLRGRARRDGLCRLGDVVVAVDGRDVSAISTEHEPQVCAPVVAAALCMAATPRGHTSCCSRAAWTGSAV